MTPDPRRPTLGSYDTILPLWRIFVGSWPTAHGVWLALTLLAASELLILHSLIQAGHGLQSGIWPFREMLMFGLGMGLLNRVHRSSNRRVEERFGYATKALTLDVIRKINRLDLAAFEAIGAETLRRHLSLDGPRIARAGVTLLGATGALVLAALTTIYIASFSVQLAVGTVIFLVVVQAILVAGARQVARASATLPDARADLDALSTGQLRGFEQVWQHRPRGRDLAREMRRRVDAYVATLSRVARAYFVSDATYRTTYFAVLGAIAFGLPSIMPAFSGEMRNVLLVLVFLRRPIAELFTAMPRLVEAAAALDELKGLDARLSTPDRLDVSAGGPGFTDADAPIRLRGVTYRYPDTDAHDGFTFGPIDLTIHRGEIIFVTGRNGSGKSTFLKLLTGLYQPADGAIIVGDTPVGAADAQRYRDLFAAVFADAPVFARLRGDCDRTPERVRELLDMVGLTGIVDIDRDRFTTIELSTGQRKRLAFVVARLADRPVYVFDEWAADQDPESRAAFYTRLLPMLKAEGATVIAVTHDDDHFGAADRCVRLEGGRVVER